MTMIPGGGATVFSPPPLCRARGLCFFFPLCSVLFLFSLSGSAGVGSADGGGMVGLLVVAGRNGGGAGGSATVALLFPLLSCSFPLLCISKKQSHVWFPLSLLFLFSSSSFSSPLLPRFCILLPSALQKISPPSSCLPLSVRLPFSLSPKFCPPGVPLFLKKSSPLVSVLSPVFIGSRGRGSPYPVQVQGMVAWELQGMVV